MKSIEEMIQELCPKGVKWSELGKIGAFENIGTDKKIVDGEKMVTLLNYVDVYKHKKIDSSIPQMIVSASATKCQRCTVEKGDIFITPSSETKDDIGHSALIMESIPNAVYSYHIMRYRLFEYNYLTSTYINYCFDTDIVRNQIFQKAQGLTRFGLSKDKFASIQIPLPPLPIQQVIADTLDKFTSMIENIDEEIELRQKQYEEYRNKLLSFSEDDESVEWKKLGEVCEKVSNIKWNEKSPSSEYQYIDLSSVSIDNHKIVATTSINKLSAPSRAQQIVKCGDILLGTTRPTLKRYCLVSGSYNNQICSTGYCVIRPNKASVKWIYYNITHNRFWDYCEVMQRGANYPTISNSDTFAYTIPIPSLSRQQEIVDILDKFELVIANLKEERELRRQQYEYYREKLLTF